MTEMGLRERKKARTRRQIAEAAARLFAEHGYEQVTVRDIASEAEVAEQTIYNYFQTKEQLVTDRDQHVQQRLVELIATRAPGVTPAAAIREFVRESIDSIPRIPAQNWRGELGYLAAVSPVVHRLSLEMADRQADAIATAISGTTQVSSEVAKLNGIAIASVFQIIISHAGRRTLDGLSQTEIADELHGIADAVLHELDVWQAHAEPARWR